MIRRYRALLSLRSLAQRRWGRRGQMTTLMLLLITGGLIGALAMANLGQLAVTSVTASNVADSAVLQLASQLASKSYGLWDALKGAPDDEVGGLKKCKSGGLLGIILAVIVAIIAIVVSILAGLVAPMMAQLGTMLSLAIIGAVGGAIGGAIGGGITGGWSGAAMGALQGAAIGAAIGAAVGAPLSGPMMMTSGSIGFAGGTVAATAAGALTAAAAIYNGVVQDQLMADAMRALNKILNGLSERSRIREGVYLTALTQTIDDPNMTAVPRSVSGIEPTATCYWPDPARPGQIKAFKIVGDPDDTDADGDTKEQVPCFQIWWNKRIEALKANSLATTRLPSLVDQFIDGPLKRFRTQAQASYATRSSFIPWWWRPGSGSGSSSGLLARGDIEGHGIRDLDGSFKYEGVLPAISRALERSGRNVTFWKPGPTYDQYSNWLSRQETCDTEACADMSRLPGWDSLDAMVEQLQTFAAFAMELENASADEIMGTIEVWLPIFYDPDPAEHDDYYDQLKNARDEDGNLIGTVAQLTAWRQELERLRQGLPKCQGNFRWVSGWRLDGLLPPLPCKDIPTRPVWWGGPGSVIPNSGSIDEDTDDEFREMRSQTSVFMNQIELFRSAVKTFAAQWAAYSSENIPNHEWGWWGPNLIEYRWLDSRGDHNIKVHISNFQLARLKSSSSLTKSCTKLKDYEDPLGKKTWVEVIREDPSNMPVGGGASRSGLWDWNPTSRGSMIVHKRAHAGYGLIEDDSQWYVKLVPAPH